MEANTPHYTVLARRFRPQSFSEVVGQSHVAQALKNAIAGGRVAHAYLFTGARGVGKTSMARILAKALNCPNATDGNPCNACEICDGITSGHDVDVLEIDGASNRRIDDIRLLRSNVGVKSMRARYKVYIIDEVHMLTNEAFNALLKTLEEPPANVKFVFCTTEPNKVPDTILSRCQRFDFAAIDTQKIVERLHEIATAEGYTVEPAALELVARRAGGSMRDSQSLFDQLLAFGDKSITAKDVHRLLGTASDERLIDLAESIIHRQPARVLELFDQALVEGVQLGELVDQLLNYQRDLMVIAAGAESTPLQGVAPTNRTALAEQARRWGLPTVIAALQILAETKTRMQRSGHGRALAELALVRLTLLEEVMDLATLVDGLRGAPTASSGSGSKASTPAPPHPRQAAAPRTTPESPRRPLPPSAVDAGLNRRADAQDSEAQPPPTPPVSISDASGNEAPPTRSPVTEIEFEPGRETEILSQLVSRLSTKDGLRDHLAKVSNVAIFGPNHLEIVFPSQYHLCKGFVEKPETLGRVEKLAGELAGRPVRVTCRLDDRVAESPPPRAKPAAASSPAGATDRTNGPPINDPYAEKVRSVFGATIKSVENISAGPRNAATVPED